MASGTFAGARMLPFSPPTRFADYHGTPGQAPTHSTRSVHAPTRGEVTPNKGVQRHETLRLLAVAMDLGDGVVFTDPRPRRARFEFVVEHD